MCGVIWLGACVRGDMAGRRVGLAYASIDYASKNSILC